MRGATSDARRDGRDETSRPRYVVVVPTVGRPSLVGLLTSLGAGGPDDPNAPDEVVVVDDRRRSGSTRPGLSEVAGLSEVGGLPEVGGKAPRVLRSGGRGPAYARNRGWQAVAAPWVVFLDDDVLVPADWTTSLVADLRDCEASVGGCQGGLKVPLPVGRRPTDFERGTAGLAAARWVTADMAYRREALVAVGGFDERFPRAYREDADLALRVRRAGWGLQQGRRVTCHPVRPTDDWVSLRVQAGNADDALMRRLHGPRWRHEAEVPRGRLRAHAVAVAVAVGALAAAVAGRRTPARVAALTCAGLTAEFAVRRILPGPRPGEDGWRAEWRRMLLTSPLIPFAAVAHRLRGEWRVRREVVPWPPRLRAVLFDRDGTLVEDVPYNPDPDEVRPMQGAAEAVRRLRAAGVAVGVVSNQSGVGRGLLTVEQVQAVNRRVDELLGPFDTWQVCPHAPDDSCRCRKPAPGMVLAAARGLGVDPAECAVVGDIGADVQAAAAAGARGVLVPTSVTLPEEVDRAPVVAGDLLDAVGLLLTATSGDQREGGRGS